MNEQNLKPFNQLTESERREISRKGAAASVEKRRQNKSWREIAQTLGNGKVKDKKLLGIVEKYFETDGKVTHDVAIIARAISEAEKGKMHAARFLADLKGEITQQVETKQTITLDLDAKKKLIAEKLKELNND